MGQKREVEVYEDVRCPVCKENWTHWCRKCNSVYCKKHVKGASSHYCNGTPGFAGKKK